MAFRNPWLLAPADAIRDRLGGTKGYVGVHARVGDGQFMWRARENMERAWRTVVSRLNVQQEAVDAMWTKVGVPVPEDKEGEGWRRHIRRAKVEERSEWTKLDGGWNSDDDDDDQPPLVKRADDLTHPLPPLVNLTCRSPLHTDPTLLAFNTPIYLATDSRTPTTDPVLAPFFLAFPCTFILSDFDRPSELNGGAVVESVGAMLRLVNKLDGTPLGRLLLPFLEATVAAKGYTTVGTYASTFSCGSSLLLALRVDAESAFVGSVRGGRLAQGVPRGQRRAHGMISGAKERGPHTDNCCTHYWDVDTFVKNSIQLDDRSARRCSRARARGAFARDRFLSPDLILAGRRPSHSATEKGSL